MDINSVEDAYRCILKWGIQRIRDAAGIGDVKYCEIEAEHLHNTPDHLSRQANDRQHGYYFEKE